MLGKLLKMGAYAKSPKTTFSILHPRTALKLGAAMWVARQVFGGKKKGRQTQRQRALRN